MFDAQTYLKTLPEHPGVYCMKDALGHILYVGKARSLKKRVSQYFQGEQSSIKTRRMVSQIASIEVTLTESETDALLLEASLIKRHHPKYNILMRDDKSYPYIYLSGHSHFPRIDYVRGQKKKTGRYFGPYATLGSARETLALLQKCFALRQCKDSVFQHRTRPCLQYQIHRCSAPCVGLISETDYQKLVESVASFLEGGEDEILVGLSKAMDKASRQRDYEQAAHCRDQIQILRKLQKHQFHSDEKSQIDVIAVTERHGEYVVELLRVRSGELASHECFFPKTGLDSDGEKEVLIYFLHHYYFEPLRQHLFARRVLLPFGLEERSLLEEGIKKILHHSIRLVSRASESEKYWQRMAFRNAEQALVQRDQRDRQHERQLHELQQVLSLSSPLEQIECLDISHTGGEATKGSCVVFNCDGADKKAYRQYDVEGIHASDDYEAMRWVVRRRYAKMVGEGGRLPDLLLIDGGLGQLNAVREVLLDLQLDQIVLLGVAKGRSRKPGLERLFTDTGKLLQLPPQSGAFHLIQYIRDESHRFAITAHRKKRDSSRQSSVLESIRGVGPKKRQALLKYFGGLQGLKKASVAEIKKVPGVTESLAEQIKKLLG